MIRKVFILVSLMLCLGMVCGCTNKSVSMTQTEQQTQTGTQIKDDELQIKDDELQIKDNESIINTDLALKVIRYPTLGSAQNADYSAYYESGLLYPSQSSTVDSLHKGTYKKFVLKNKEYAAAYAKSKVYIGTTSDFLKHDEYDLYVVDGKADFQVFKDTGVIKKVYIYQSEVECAEKIVTDFSEKGLISAAELVLTDLYGSSILEYLNGYYQFDYAKLMEYANSELNRYAVCYRAYLNGIPTDDLIYVTFSLSGALIGVSAPKYLQYMDVDETLLIPLDKLEDAICSELEKLDYSRIHLRDDELPCYYTRNASGELYYVTEWASFKQYTEDTGVTIVETMAVKAEWTLSSK